MTTKQQNTSKPKPGPKPKHTNGNQLARLNSKQIAAIGASVALLAAVTVCVVVGLAATNDGSPSTIQLATSDDGTPIALQDGENLISKSGVYVLSGASKGYVHVNVKNNAEVKIILNNVSITNDAGPAIHIESRSNTYLEFSGQNTIESKPTEDLNGAIHSKGSLLIAAQPEATLSVASTRDGIISKDDLELASGTFVINSTEKAIKSKNNLTITGGTYTITSDDDALHSGGSLAISDGNFNISTGDDAVHSDTTLNISGGHLAITKSYEGLEANSIDISGGEINIVASDDGINATNSSENATFRAGDAKLVIRGGEVTVDANGDGLDSNGSIVISGGTTYVNGPTTSANAAVDCDGSIEISGGTIIAVGAAGMAQNATTATQPSLLLNLSATYSESLEIGGLKFTPKKSYNSVLISSPTLKVGETYNLVIGQKTATSVTVADNITTIGGGFGNFGGFGGGGGRFDGYFDREAPTDERPNMPNNGQSDTPPDAPNGNFSKEKPNRKQ